MEGQKKPSFKSPAQQEVSLLLQQDTDKDDSPLGSCFLIKCLETYRSSIDYYNSYDFARASNN